MKIYAIRCHLSMYLHRSHSIPNTISPNPSVHDVQCTVIRSINRMYLLVALHIHVSTCCLMPIPEYNTVSRIHLPNQCTHVHGSFICICNCIHFLSTCSDNICSKRETIRKSNIKIQNCFNPQRNFWDQNLYSIRCFVFQFQVWT